MDQELVLFRSRAELLSYELFQKTCQKEQLTEQPVEEESCVPEPGEPNKVATDMIYTIEDAPPWYLCILLGLQARPS